MSHSSWVRRNLISGFLGSLLSPEIASRLLVWLFHSVNYCSGFIVACLYGHSSLIKGRNGGPYDCVPWLMLGLFLHQIRQLWHLTLGAPEGPCCIDRLVVKGVEVLINLLILHWDSKGVNKVVEGGGDGCPTVIWQVSVVRREGSVCLPSLISHLANRILKHCSLFLVLWDK